MATTTSSSSNTLSARTTYRVRATDVSQVTCHRLYKGREQYLVRWKSRPEYPVPPRAILSWHGLEQLTSCMHYVQSYVDTLPKALRTGSNDANAESHAHVEASRKRKSPGADACLANVGNGHNGLLTPEVSHLSREASTFSHSSTGSHDSSVGASEPAVYNGVLEKKAGYYVAKKSELPGVKVVNATKLPSLEMRQHASSIPVPQAVQEIRKAFLLKLRAVPKTRLENNVDESTPSLDFTFINEVVLRDGVVRADPETFEGCQKPCRPNMGQGIGCEYPKQCTCLEYAAVNEPALEKLDEALYERYMEQKAAGGFIDTAGLPKRFPYDKPSVDNRIPSTLQTFYREQRHPIYECNLNCRCGPVCKSRLVQKGRKVPLTIFKTANRGWGVKCDEDLIQGEFIDTYLGEIVTNEEADDREARAGKDKASYLYSLDKFVGDDETLTVDTCFVVDGQYMGGPTRFINHSCEPNCRQYTVSYNKHDLRIYDLAFFAYENITAGTELTFDYMDKDEEEEEEVLMKREAAANDPENQDKKPCNCGAAKCRGYLWV